MLHELIGLKNNTLDTRSKEEKLQEEKKIEDEKAPWLDKKKPEELKVS